MKPKIRAAGRCGLQAGTVRLNRFDWKIKAHSCAVNLVAGREKQVL